MGASLWGSAGGRYTGRTVSSFLDRRSKTCKIILTEKVLNWGSSMGDFLISLVTGGASGILGGITGLVGTWVKSRHEVKMFELRSKDRRERQKMQLDSIRLENEGALKIAEVRREEADDTAAGKSLAKSYEMEPKRFSEGLKLRGKWMNNLVATLMFLLDFIRGAMRPGLTMYLAILVTLIYWQTIALLETYAIQPTPDQAFAMWQLLIGTFVYLFTTVVTWWFGDRNRQKPPEIKL